MSRYYSDEVRGPRARVEERFDRRVWGGVFALLTSALARPLFAEDFALTCPDGKGVCGCDEDSFWLALRAELPGLGSSIGATDVPETLDILDLLRFMHRHAGGAKVRDHDDFFGHDHLKFNRDQGRTLIREEINNLLARNGLAYELDVDGRIRHLPAPVVRELVRFALPPTRDDHFDRLLETARINFTDVDPAVRRNALEKLWDALSGSRRSSTRTRSAAQPR